MRAFRKIKATDREVQTLQNQVEQALNPILKLAILDYVILTDVVVTTSGLVLEHKLNRQPLGWILIDNQANSRVWRTGWNDKLLYLDTSNDTTISLMVF